MTYQINRPTAERLALYYHFIEAHLTSADETVSSQQIAEIIEVDPTLVRKDMAAISLRGRPNAGFDSNQVKARIRDVLGFNVEHRTVLIGAGQLGSAIAAYPDFRNYGLHIQALFDSDPAKVGTIVASRMVRGIPELREIVRTQNITLAIITVPADAAQEVADQLVEAGIGAIWCFSATHIHVPQNVIIRHEHLSAGLAELLYRIESAKDSCKNY